MLSPVPHHETHTQLQERKNKDKQCRSPADIVPEQIHHQVAAEFPKGCFQPQKGLSFAQEVGGQLQPDEEVEAADVAGEISQTVALVTDR